MFGRNSSIEMSLSGCVHRQVDLRVGHHLGEVVGPICSRIQGGIPASVRPRLGIGDRRVDAVDGRGGGGERQVERRHRRRARPTVAGLPISAYESRSAALNRAASGCRLPPVDGRSRAGDGQHEIRAVAAASATAAGVWSGLADRWLRRSGAVVAAARCAAGAGQRRERPDEDHVRARQLIPNGSTTASTASRTTPSAISSQGSQVSRPAARARTRGGTPGRRRPAAPPGRR